MLSAGYHYVRDVAAAAWIRGRLHPFAQDVGSLVPDGFAAYARVFHPARSADGRAVTWRSIAEANGRRVHPEMQFGNVAGAWCESPLPDLWTHAPQAGTLTADLARALVSVLRSHTATPGRCWFAVWEGWGGFDPGTPRFELPQRRYFLAEGEIDEAATTVYGNRRSAYQSASLWWPDDCAWLVATEVDLTYTYVGATARCIEELIADPKIEALQSRLSDGITADSDRLNPPVAPPFSPRPSLASRVRGLFGR